VGSTRPGEIAKRDIQLTLIVIPISTILSLHPQPYFQTYMIQVVIQMHTKFHHKPSKTESPKSEEGVNGGCLVPVNERPNKSLALPKPSVILFPSVVSFLISNELPSSTNPAAKPSDLCAVETFWRPSLFAATTTLVVFFVLRVRGRVVGGVVGELFVTGV